VETGRAFDVDGEVERRQGDGAGRAPELDGGAGGRVSQRVAGSERVDRTSVEPAAVAQSTTSRPTRSLHCMTTTHTHTHDTTVSRYNWHTHTHPFNGPFSGTTRVSRYQKGKTNLDFTEARASEWQWHQLSHMLVCNSLQTDNNASTPQLSFYRPVALPAAQPTASKH